MLMHSQRSIAKSARVVSQCGGVGELVRDGVWSGEVSVVKCWRQRKMVGTTPGDDVRRRCA